MKKVLLGIFVFLGLALSAQNTQFTKRIGGSSDESSQQIIQVSSGDYYILSNTESYGTGGTDIYVTRTDGLGGIKWSYAFGTTGEDIGTSMRSTLDGGVIVGGYSNGLGTSSEDAIVFKLNGSGVIQWSKNIQSDSNERIMGLCEGRLGEVYAVGYKQYDSIENNMIVAKFASTGNNLWYKSYGGLNNDEAYGIIEDGKGRLMVVGSTENDSISIGGKDIQIMRIDGSGNVIWIKNYGTANNEQAQEVRALSNYNFVIAGYAETISSAEDMMVMSIDSNGNVKYAYHYGTTNNDRAYDLHVSAAGIVTLVGSIEDLMGVKNMALLQTSSNGVVINSTIIGGSNDDDGISPSSVAFSPDGGYTMLGNGTSLHYASDYDLYMVRTDEIGSASCGFVLENVLGNNLSFTTASYDTSFTQVNIFNNSLTRVSVTAQDSTMCCELEARVISDSITMCTNDNVRLGLAGLSGYTYTWTSNNSSFSSSSPNPQVSPSVNTLYKLVVSSTNDKCAPDSAYVYVTVNTRLNVDFVRDTLFCEGENVKVTAYPGLNSYIWQGDGYTLANNPVTLNKQDTITLVAIDQNSCVYRDTFAVIKKPLPRFSLGNDTTICANLDITFTGPPNMVDYRWNGVSGGNQTYTTSVQQEHTLEVTDVFGCKNDTSIMLLTNPFSSFSLGMDTGFCKGGSYEIQGPGALTGYIWNDTASTVQNLRVFAPGIYHLTAFNSYLCPYSDTIEVVEYALPVYSLGADTGVCEGEAAILKGPSGNYEYLWNTGSDMKDITVDAEDTYSLTITNFKGCSYTDSVDFSIYENPTVNLGNDTAISEGESLTLRAGTGFASYLWSNTSPTDKITVTDTGFYSVIVTDNNGCKGGDTIHVKFNLSVEYLNGYEVSVFPVPASDQITISSEALKHNSSIEMYNMYGGLVYRSDVSSNNHVIDLKGLAEGQYLINVTQDNNRVVFKVIVNR